MYFQKFPYTRYEFPDEVVRNFKNISLRPNIISEYITDGSNLEEYVVQDGETPETIAFDLYDDVNSHWILMMVNNIMSLYDDWPKSTSMLFDFLIEKYQTQTDSDGNTVVMSKTSTEEFLEFVGTPTNNYESRTVENVVIRPHHFVDIDGDVYSYGTVTGEKVDARGRTIEFPEVTPVSHFDYETALNDKKRVILVPSKDTAIQINRELGKILNG